MRPFNTFVIKDKEDDGASYQFSCISFGSWVIESTEKSNTSSAISKICKMITLITPDLLLKGGGGGG